jgi:hypothetical protein
MIIGSLTRAEYGWLRVSDTLIGAVVGVAVDALVVPPSHPPRGAVGAGGLRGGTVRCPAGPGLGPAVGLPAGACARGPRGRTGSRGAGTRRCGGGCSGRGKPPLPPLRARAASGPGAHRGGPAQPGTLLDRGAGHRSDAARFRGRRRRDGGAPVGECASRAPGGRRGCLLCPAGRSPGRGVRRRAGAGGRRHRGGRARGGPARRLGLARRGADGRRADAARPRGGAAAGAGPHGAASSRRRRAPVAPRRPASAPTQGAASRTSPGRDVVAPTKAPSPRLFLGGGACGARLPAILHGKPWEGLTAAHRVSRAPPWRFDASRHGVL